jgi:D-cysteine desulfhydrase family pyridoxal phosphate-dependent enzyme
MKGRGGNTLPIDVDHFALAHLPTPLEPLDRLRRHLGVGAQLFIKRDDCTGLALGGNKTRKLEFLIGDALAKGATAVISEGGLQSNHVRQTAAASARAGLTCHLVLDHRVPVRTDNYRGNGNLLLDRLLGATVHLCEAGETRRERSLRLVDELRQAGERPYYIPTGGSNEIGALGYVAALAELQRQAASAGIAVDRIVAASSSGGTQAGLLAGQALSGLGCRVSGIDVDGDADKMRSEIGRIAMLCAARLGVAAERLAEPEIVRGHCGEGYGIPTPGMVEALRLLATLEGIVLDPVYTGKAMAGLIAMLRAGEIGAGETVVFIHTGGAPALFGYADGF